MNIDCPHELNDISATRYVNDIYRAKHEPELILNFSTLNFVSPSGALILALGIREIIRERLSSNLDTQALGARKKSGAVSYLSHFGFFQFIGLDVGNKPNEVAGGRNFLPITTIDINDFDNNKVAIQEQIAGITAEAGRTLRSFRETVGSAEVLKSRAIKDYIQAKSRYHWILRRNPWRRLNILKNVIGYHLLIRTSIVSSKANNDIVFWDNVDSLSTKSRCFISLKRVVPCPP